MEIKDVAIIGAGPAGLFAVFECGMLGLSCVVVDSLEEIGGQCSALYPEKPIYDIPGFPKIEAGALIEQLEAQAAPFKPVYHLNQQIVSIGNKDAVWTLGTSTNQTILAKTIIIAAGAGAFGPNRPPLDGLAAYEGQSVFYMVRRKESFRDKKIVIAGGGDSAVDWALTLAPMAKALYVVHRRDKFRAAPESVRQMELLRDTGKLELLTFNQLYAIEGEAGQLQKVQIKDDKDNIRSLEADILLPFFGLSAELGPLANWGLNLANHHIAVDPSTCETNMAGIYAIGDIAAYDKKLKLILTGFAEAAQAAHAIRDYLNPGDPHHFEYSTTKGLPGQV